MEDKKLKAKMDMLKELKDSMSSMMGDDVRSGLQKVTVAAPDKSGLKMGLDKAKHIMESPASEKSESPEEEAAETPAEEAAETPEEESAEMKAGLDQCDSPEEIDAMIKHLQEKKAKLSASKY